MKGSSMLIAVLQLMKIFFIIPWLVWLLVIFVGRSDDSGYDDPLFWLLGSTVGTLDIVIGYLEKEEISYISVGLTAFYIVMLWITRKNWRNRDRRRSLKRFGYKAQAARDKLLKNLKKIKVPVGLKPIPQPV